MNGSFRTNEKRDAQRSFRGLFLLLLGLLLLLLSSDLLGATARSLWVQRRQRILGVEIVPRSAEPTSF